jgi:hypothetical protein
MKDFTGKIGNNINLNIDTETEDSTKKAESDGLFELEEKEESKVGTMVYFRKTFLRDYDKFIKRYGDRSRSVVIEKMLEFAMAEIKKQDTGGGR